MTIATANLYMLCSFLPKCSFKQKCIQNLYFSIKWNLLKFSRFALYLSFNLYFVLLLREERKLVRYTFLSNHNVHKSLCGLCFWAPQPLIGPGTHKQSPNELL